MIKIEYKDGCKQPFTIITNHKNITYEKSPKSEKLIVCLNENIGITLYKQDNQNTKDYISCTMKEEEFDAVASKLMSYLS
jgi:hypothetical protein